MSVVLRYIAVCQNVGLDTTAQSISDESNYVFLQTTNPGPWLHSSELTQCDRHKGWICLWISTVTGNPYHCTGLDYVTVFGGYWEKFDGMWE
jgi:hypothetical protein